MGPPAGSQAGEASYYEALGVDFDASEEEIRKRYHSVVRTLHPDRRRPGSSGGDALERFHQVQNAWRCLSDPTRRLLYDLRNFGRSSLATGGDTPGSGTLAEAELVRLQKEQAKRDVGNMEVVLEKVLRRERAARGVIVRTAMYGDLRLREDCLEECMSGRREIKQEDLIGPVIDVAMPLQCLVEQHNIVLPGGSSASKADLPGFYNPVPLDLHVELSLYVLYEFRGALHEVIVGDRETLSLPYRKHAIPAGKAPRGPFSPANVTVLRREGPVGVAASPGVGGGAGTKPAYAQADAAAALQRAVSAYRLHRLQDQGPGEVTKAEFTKVALGTGVALAAVAMWTAASGRALRS